MQRAGQLAEALVIQRRVIEDSSAGPAPEHAEDLHRLAILLFASGDFAGAAQSFDDARSLDPAHPSAARNLGLSLIRIGRLPEAVTILTEFESGQSDRLDVLDALAEAYGKLGDLESCRKYGERALAIRDEQARAERSSLDFRLSEAPPPPYRSDGGKRNVIAFSLFGNQPRYLDGACRNAVIAHYVYPGWTCRFYCDESVPREIRNALQQTGSEVVAMPRPQCWTDALFWRFLVAEDPAVGRFLVRDCDSVLNARERIAVNEWLTSPFYFHAMRDFPSHTDLLLAGLWGGTAGILPPLTNLLQGFCYDPVTESRTADQLFLGRRVWPLIRTSCLIHDRCYRNFGAKPFPPGTEMAGQRHVGENDHSAGHLGWRIVLTDRENH